MRKSIVLRSVLFFCFVLGCFAILFLSINAEKSEHFDSTYIEDEVYSYLNVDSDTPVFKIFNGMYLWAFAEDVLVEDLIETKNIKVVEDVYLQPL